MKIQNIQPFIGDQQNSGNKKRKKLTNKHTQITQNKTNDKTTTKGSGRKLLKK